MSDLSHTSEDDDNVRGLVLVVVVVHVWCVVHVSDADAWLCAVLGRSHVCVVCEHSGHGVAMEMTIWQGWVSLPQQPVHDKALLMVCVANCSVLWQVVLTS